MFQYFWRQRLPPFYQLLAAGNTGVYFLLWRNFKPIRMRDLMLFQYFPPTRVNKCQDLKMLFKRWIFFKILFTLSSNKLWKTLSLEYCFLNIIFVQRVQRVLWVFVLICTVKVFVSWTTILWLEKTIACKEIMWVLFIFSKIVKL